mgnify:CR=1 FL=1
MENNSNKKVGPIIGALIIVVILVIAALYVWGGKLNKNDQAPVTPGTEQVGDVSSATPVVVTPAKMSSSDDVDSISKDLNSIQTTGASAF